MKTRELTGAQLDWAVLKAQGTRKDSLAWLVRDWVEDRGRPYLHYNNAPSWCWMSGGPIIEKNLIVLSPDPALGWIARSYMDATVFSGPTPLIAAMRCYVASKLGDEVDIPKELK